MFFFDLGSGTGKIAVQVALMTPCKKVVGIELSETRHQHAKRAMNEAEFLLKDKGQHKSRCNILRHLIGIHSSGKLQFQHGDIMDNTYKDATHVFAASTTWPDSLLERIVENLAEAPQLKTFSTLREVSEALLDQYPSMNLWKVVKVDVSWTDAAEMHVYTFN